MYLTQKLKYIDSAQGDPELSYLSGLYHQFKQQVHHNIPQSVSLDERKLIHYAKHLIARLDQWNKSKTKSQYEQIKKIQVHFKG